MLAHPIWRFSFAVGASGGTPVTYVASWGWPLDGGAFTARTGHTYTWADPGQSDADRMDED